MLLSNIERSKQGWGCKVNCSPDSFWAT